MFEMQEAGYQRQGTSLTSEDQSEKLQLFLSCRNLADLDMISTTDSFLLVKLLQPNKAEKTILKTKVYWNDLNPDYAETVTIDYFFEIRQKLKFQVYHEASPPKLVGAIETTLGQIFGSPHNGFKKNILSAKAKVGGQIIIRCEKVEKVTNNLIEFDLQAYQLPTQFSFLCFGSTCNPFFRIYRVREKDELLIYESQPVTNNQSPKFKRCKLSERRLCKNDPDRNFQIRFYNYSNMGNHSYQGKVVMTVNRIIDPKSYSILDKKNRMKGNLRIQNVKRLVKHSFADYIYGGLQLMLITCIDFTASNGSAKSPQSLHYIQNNKRSQYEEALEEVSRILLDYDSDKLVPVYGFGAKVTMPNFNSFGKAHNCFPLNGNEQNAHVFMAEGIIQAYRNAIQYLQFAGPTFFSALLGQAIQQCKELRKQMNQYMIVFILTDGQIHDKTQVMDQIVECCNLPISLIIVGVGNGPFDIMEQLDDDDCQMVDSRGRKTTRDLVQFVEFKKFRNNGVQLAREVLEELPRQVEEYYQIVNISPLQFKSLPPPPPQMMPPPPQMMPPGHQIPSGHQIPPPYGYQQNIQNNIQNMPNPYR